MSQVSTASTPGVLTLRPLTISRQCGRSPAVHVMNGIMFGPNSLVTMSAGDPGGTTGISAVEKCF